MIYRLLIGVYRGTLILWMALSIPSDSVAQYFTLGHSRKSETVSFQFVNNLIIVPLHINGHGPYNFVLDTGVGLILITDPDLRKVFSERSKVTIKLNGIGEGGEMTANIYPATEIVLNNGGIKGTLPVAILKEDPFNLSAFVGMPVHGLIGYELFASFIVRINYMNRNLSFYRHESSYILRKGVKIPITIEERKPYLEVGLRFENGQTELAKLLIDSGSGNPLSLETREGVPYKLPGKKIEANLGVGLSGLISGHIARVPLVIIGRYKLQDVICAFPDFSNVAAKVYSIARNGSLGNNILKHFNVVFDYEREAMYLKPNTLYNEPFEHDMSGLEIAQLGQDNSALNIVRVEKGSAAEAAGLKKGDKIISFNFKPIPDLSIDEINNILRSQNGRNVILEIDSEQRRNSKFIILTLKRRI